MRKSNPILAVFIGCLLAACSSSSSSTTAKTYVFSLDQKPNEVWAQSVLALDGYTILEANYQQGLLRTQTTRGSYEPFALTSWQFKGLDQQEGFRGPASLPDESWGTHKSSIELKIEEIDDERTQLSISKSTLRYNPHRGTFEPVASNGTEEKALYQVIKQLGGAQ